jgi:hypothetical protein
MRGPDRHGATERTPRPQTRRDCHGPMRVLYARPRTTFPLTVAPGAATVRAMAHSPNWYRDPSGNYELRYWNGDAWTEHVSTAGVQSVDPIPDAPSREVAAIAALEKRGGVGGLLRRDSEKKERRDAVRQTVDLMLRPGADLDALSEQLNRHLATARLPDRKRRKLQDTAFRAAALSFLSDELLTQEEEDRLLEISAAVGMAQADLDQMQDVMAQLVLGRANDGRFTPMAAPGLMAKPGEDVYAEFAARLLKEVTHREFRGGYSGVSFRVAKGVRFHTGGARGKSVVVGTSLETADSGFLSITSRRAVFVGQRKTVEHRYDKLVGVQVFADAVTLNVSNRQSTSMIAVADGPYVAALMNACAQRSL